jgi:hypothetical protein
LLTLKCEFIIKTIAGLQGVTKLSKDAQKIINGGRVSGVCAVSVSAGAGGAGTGGGGGILDFGSQPSGSAASGAADSWCVNHIAQYGGSCRYDCAWDGYGA